MDKPINHHRQQALEHIINQLADQGWVVTDQLFTQEEMVALRQECLESWQHGAFHQAAIGHAQTQHLRSDIRSDSVAWLDVEQASPAVSRYFDKLEHIRQAINCSLFLGLEELESHFAVYPVGARYKKHLDRFQDDDARIISSVLYLNQDWSSDIGGQLRLFLDKDGTETRDIYPNSGTLVLFLSDIFWHEVLPAQRQRLSITGWFRRRQSVIHL
ncbi:2OG-Fe(II) oxygenase [Neisseriaceae bacterium TC5R-5]|nr:2OG-Fe(II) oxygenase [Neisseriaceae bacterium TC5R-5]